mmetsp:Transcript_72088/g.146218  ORF Transcript_72088/g.146218 Transcript_72088/m.146218 type:complete len:233 (+) Transcript_72088:72-770(+)
MSKGFKAGGNKALLAWFASLNPGNILLERTSQMPKAEMEEQIESSKWLKDTVALMSVQYKDAMYPNMTKKDPDIDLIDCPIVGISSLLDPGAQPAAIQTYEHNTAGQFQLVECYAGHMDVLYKESGLMERLGPDMAATAEQRDDIPLIPRRGAREEAAIKAYEAQQEAILAEQEKYYRKWRARFMDEVPSEAEQAYEGKTQLMKWATKLRSCARQPAGLRWSGPKGTRYEYA